MTYRWVLKPVVLALHDEQLVEHGGLPGLRDEGLLDSALARPRQLLGYNPEATTAAVAAAYAFGLSRNHPFVDGNKRTSLVVTALFLSLNGCELVAGDADLYRTWMRLASDAGFSEEDLATWLGQAIAKEA